MEKMRHFIRNRQTCNHEWEIVEESENYIISVCILCGLEEFKETDHKIVEQCAHAFDIVGSHDDGFIMIRCAKCGLKAQTTNIDSE